MELLISKPQIGLFRLVEDGTSNGNKCKWYYRLSTDDWTSNPANASLMPRSIAEMHLERFKNLGTFQIEFVPQVSGVNR